jgi:hypothetical protein
MIAVPKAGPGADAMNQTDRAPTVFSRLRHLPRADSNATSAAAH